MRRFHDYGDKGVTPQAYLRNAYDDASNAISNMKRQAHENYMKARLDQLGLTGEMEEVAKHFKTLTGNSLNYSHQCEPTRESPLGKQLYSMDIRYDAASSQIEEAWTEASLRLNLGKDPDGIVKTLEAFSKSMDQIVQKLEKGSGK